MIISKLKKLNECLSLFVQVHCYRRFRYSSAINLGVGKSCVVLQLIEQKMNSNHDVTIGVEFAAKNLKINRKTIKLQIWDTAGQEKFKTITQTYYRGAMGIVLAYAINER